MTDDVAGETGSPSFPKGVMLRDACPEICVALSNFLRESGDAELAAQWSELSFPFKDFPEPLTISRFWLGLSRVLRKRNDTVWSYKSTER